jgi:hypothetical protein
MIRKRKKSTLRRRSRDSRLERYGDRLGRKESLVLWFLQLSFNVEPTPTNIVTSFP